MSEDTKFDFPEDIDLTEFEMKVVEAVGKAYSIRVGLMGSEDIDGPIDIPTDLIAICMKSIGRLPNKEARKKIDRAMDVLRNKECTLQIISEDQACVVNGVCVMCDIFDAVPLKSKEETGYRIYTVYEKPILCLTEEERSKLLEEYEEEGEDDDE